MTNFGAVSQALVESDVSVCLEQIPQFAQIGQKQILFRTKKIVFIDRTRGVLFRKNNSLHRQDKKSFCFEQIIFCIDKTREVLVQNKQQFAEIGQDEFLFENKQQFTQIRQLEFLSYYTEKTHIKPKPPPMSDLCYIWTQRFLIYLSILDKQNQETLMHAWNNIV